MEFTSVYKVAEMSIRKEKDKGISCLEIHNKPLNSGSGEKANVNTDLHYYMSFRSCTIERFFYMLLATCCTNPGYKASSVTVH